MATITPEDRVEILFFKSLGSATAFPATSISQQPVVNAGMKVIPALHIFKQHIPPFAPDEGDLIHDTTFNGHPGTPAGTSACRRLYSNTYPWVVKYENLQVINYLPERTYNGYVNFGDERGVQNLLAQTIPFNFDSAGSYGVSVCKFVVDPF